MSKELLTLALEAVEIGFKAEQYMTDADYALQDKAVAALREALAEQPAQQEPVAWCSQCGRKCPPAQRTWVGLSDAQNTVIWANSQSVDEAIRATEKQLMENNI